MDRLPDKNEILSKAVYLKEDQIESLIKDLESKEDAVRYPAFLMLQARSGLNEDIYPHFDNFIEKISSEKSYSRSIGLMLMAANAKWDKENKLDGVIDLYLSLCDDEKPVTVRQCIQSLLLIVPEKKHLCGKIADKLLSIDLASRKETQRKLLLLDIVSVLLSIQATEPQERIQRYLEDAKSKMDKKTIKQLF